MEFVEDIYAFPLRAAAQARTLYTTGKTVTVILQYNQKQNHLTLLNIN